MAKLKIIEKDIEMIDGEVNIEIEGTDNRLNYSEGDEVIDIKSLV